MPRLLNDPRRPLLIGADNGEAVLVRFTGYDVGRTNMHAGDVMWVGGDGVEEMVATGFIVYETLNPDPRAPILPDGHNVTTAMPAEVAAVPPRRTTKTRKAAS